MHNHNYFSKKAKKKNSFHSIFKILLLFVINKTRFYTHAGIEHPHEIVLLARSTTGIAFASFFFGLLLFVDDVEEKKKPEECGSTTNNSQAGKE